MKYKALLLTAIMAGACMHAEARAASILGSADSFAVLGASTVTSTGPTVVGGNLGVWTGTAVVGFPPGIVTAGGVIHAGDAVAQQAQSDTATAYNALAAMNSNVNLTGQNLGGLTLAPGVYHFNSSAQLTGTLTLDAQGIANAYWVFQIGSTLTTAGASAVNMINVGPNGGSDDGLFWQVGSSATLGKTTDFEGNILALESITLNTGATIHNGRALAHTGAVTMDSNIVTIASPPPNFGSGLDGGLTFGSTGAIVAAPLPSATLMGSLMLLGLGCYKFSRQIGRRIMTRRVVNGVMPFRQA